MNKLLLIIIALSGPVQAAGLYYADYVTPPTALSGEDCYTMHSPKETYTVVCGEKKIRETSYDKDWNRIKRPDEKAGE